MGCLRENWRLGGGKKEKATDGMGPFNQAGYTGGPLNVGRQRKYTVCLGGKSNGETVISAAIAVLKQKRANMDNE